MISATSTPTITRESRCSSCSKLLLKLREADAVYEIKCTRCGIINSVASSLVEDTVIADGDGRAQYINGWATKLPNCKIGAHIGQILLIPDWAALASEQPDIISFLRAGTTLLGANWQTIDGTADFKVHFKGEAYLLISPVYTPSNVIQFVVLNFHYWPLQ